MNALSATAPLRSAAPRAGLHLAVRTYSGVAVMTFNPCHTRRRSAPLPSPAKRLISSTPQHHIKDYFPPPESATVKEVHTAWAHPVYV
jgi:hypothetical protein